MQHDHVVPRQTSRLFGLDAVALAEPNGGAASRAPIRPRIPPSPRLHETRRSAAPLSSSSPSASTSGRRLGSLVRGLPFVRRAHDVDDHADRLLFDSECRDLGETEWFDDANASLDRRVAALAIDDHCWPACTSTASKERRSAAISSLRGLPTSIMHARRPRRTRSAAVSGGRCSAPLGCIPKHCEIVTCGTGQDENMPDEMSIP